MQSILKLDRTRVIKATSFGTIRPSILGDESNRPLLTCIFVHTIAFRRVHLYLHMRNLRRARQTIVMSCPPSCRECSHHSLTIQRLINERRDDINNDKKKDINSVMLRSITEEKKNPLPTSLFPGFSLLNMQVMCIYI